MLKFDIFRRSMIVKSCIRGTAKRVVRCVQPDSKKIQNHQASHDVSKTVYSSLHTLLALLCYLATTAIFNNLKKQLTHNLTQ